MQQLIVRHEHCECSAYAAEGEDRGAAMIVVIVHLSAFNHLCIAVN